MVTAFDFDLPFAPCREPFRDSDFNSDSNSDSIAGENVRKVHGNNAQGKSCVLKWRKRDLLTSLMKLIRYHTRQ